MRTYLASGGGADRSPATARDQPRLWDRELATSIPLAGHPAGVTAIAYAADGARLATASADGIVRLFAAPDGRRQRELTVELAAGARAPAALTACFAPDGITVFVGYADGSGRLFQL